REHDREIPGCALGGRSAGQFPLVPHSCEPIDLLASCDSEGDFGTESPHLVLSANDQVRSSGIESVVAQLVGAVVRQPGGQAAAEKVRTHSSLEVEDVANLCTAVLLLLSEVNS